MSLSHNNSGWIDNPDYVNEILEQMPNKGVFGATAKNIVGSGKGQTVLLYKNFEKIGVPFHVINQGSVGSCVGCGTAAAVDMLKATEIALGDREEFNNYTAVEPIYGGARVTIGGGRLRGDGCVVSWAIQYINQYGTLARGKYGNVDISQYSADRCKKWGVSSGFPKSLENLSKEHLVTQFAKVSSYSEVCDSIANGYPVIFGSNLGFTNKRDSEGFAKVSGSWAHCQYLGACDDNNRRPAALCINSWGNWNSGPKRFDQPDGSYWLDAEVIDRICRGEAFSISGFDGYKKRTANLKTLDW